MTTENITLSGNDKIAMIGNLSTMLAAGIPILEVVDSLLEDAKKNSKKVLETLRSDLIQGRPVHISFAKFPKIFDKVTINIIKASEEAGTLDQTLSDLKENIRKDMEFNDQIRSAFIYPLFILVIFSGVIVMILTVVIPKIAVVFTSLKAKLPLPTVILITMSNALIHYPFIVIASIFAIIGIVILLFKTQRELITHIFLSLPVIKNVAKEIDLTRFTRSMYLLLNAGIPITSALILSQEIVMKKDIAEAISHARETVVGGQRLSAGMKDAKNIFPSMMIKITEAGEKTGSLDKSMKDVSEYLDYQVAKSLKTLTTLLEPLMIVLVGGLVGGIMLAIIAPIYGLISQVSTR
ncbi:MAG TPA: type II secretion system F family protein [Candidatus Saccharimonadales bacterium]|nr:type II secretion system F family protein [Candidatus Saccharimonadales bacterium]